MATYSGMRLQLVVGVLAVFLSSCRKPVSDTAIQANGDSLYPPVSYDGQYVAFFSVANNLVAGDYNNVGDVFVRDLRAGITERVSVDSQGREGDLESTWPSISGDGRFISFTSSATNLVANDTNSRPDVFVHDRETHATFRESVRGANEQANAMSFTYFPSISADGRYVVFVSKASNLVENDTNGTWDVFLRDRQGRTTTLVSATPNGRPANGSSLRAVIAGNGRYVAFESLASNLVPNDTNRVKDVFVYDRETRKTTRVSIGADGRETNAASDRPAISHDGNIIAFSSTATNLVGNDSNNTEDVFVYDVSSRRTDRVSVSSAGDQMIASAPAIDEDDIGDAICCAISALCCVIVITDRKSVVSPDGGVVLFRSDAANLVPDDHNSYQDIFVYDRSARATTRVSVSSDGSEGNGESAHHGVSFDGRYVAFSSRATNLVPDDTNTVSDIFVRDRATGQTTRVSVGSRELNAR